MTFCSFQAMASSVIYYSTHARQNEIYLFYTSKVLKHASEKMEKKMFCCCVTSASALGNCRGKCRGKLGNLLITSAKNIAEVIQDTCALMEKHVGIFA